FSPRCSIEPNATPFVSSAFAWPTLQQRSGSDVEEKVPNFVRNIQDGQDVHNLRDPSDIRCIQSTPDSYDSHEIHGFHDIEDVQKSNDDDYNAVDATDNNRDMVIVAEVPESANSKDHARASAHSNRGTNSSSIVQKNPQSVRQDRKKRPTESSDELGGALEETEAPLAQLPDRKRARMSINEFTSKLDQTLEQSPHCKESEIQGSHAQGNHGASQPMTRPMKGEEPSQKREAGNV
ncbi:MAG: hypothetical protein Q9226_006218, partial [Calogaya cf. arnoldii]